MLDFDSTLCPFESLDAFEKQYIQTEIGSEIVNVAKRVKSGEISSNVARYLCLHLIKPRRNQIVEFGQRIADEFIPIEKFEFVKEMKQEMHLDVAIVSSGIYDLIYPSAKKFDVELFATKPSYTTDNIFLGFISNGFDDTKHRGIAMNIDRFKYKNMIMVGDGDNDYEVWRNRACDNYVCYIEHSEAEFTKHIVERKARNLIELRSHLKEIIT